MSGTASDNATGGLTAEEVSQLSTEEAMIAGAEADDVFIVHRRERFPIAGTKAERRAERTVAGMFFLGFLAAVAFIVVFCGAVPYEWRLPGQGSQNFRYFTPLLGGLLGLSLAAIGIGTVLWAKWLLPEEEVVQDRHDRPEDPAQQMLTAATLVQGFHDTGIGRRSMLKATLGLAGGALGVVPLVALVGAMLKKPNRGPGQSLFHTLWANGVAVVDYRGPADRPGRPAARRPAHRVPGGARRRLGR